MRTYDDNGSENQEWFLEYVEDGFFYIRSRWSGKCLEVQNGSLESGANTWQAERTGEREQQWRLVPLGAAVEFTAPSAPVGLAAKVNKSSIALQWEANGEADLVGYTIYRSEGDGESFELIARGVTGNTFIDGGAYRAVPYRYRLRAVDHSLNRYEYLNEVVVAPLEGQNLVIVLGFENSGHDESGNANNTILVGGAGFLSGKVGSGALYFNSVTSHAQLTASVATYDELTISSWIYWTGGADEQRVFAFGN